MADRRDFIKIGLGVASGVALGQAYTIATSESSSSLPSNIVYTADEPGQWAQKVGGHLPQVNIQGKTVTITTDHAMTKNHYIVRHTLVSEDGTVIGGKVFQPEDEAVSKFELPDGHGSKFYATSFCNKHDLWVAEVMV
jgi:superoxide reductase